MISVVVPVYNVERYLPQCIDSLLQQTYRDLEVILVNDCSPDNSLKICNEYEKKDSRVKVIDKKKNEGLGNARKSGVEIAQGDWICYVDSDDWIEKNTFELLSKVLTEDVDIAVFGMTMCHENKNGEIEWKDSVYPEVIKANTPKEIGDLLCYLDSHRMYPFMCNKVYNTRFVKESGVEFNTIKSMEDFFYNIEIFEKARCVVTVDKALYNYRKTCNETLGTAYNEQFFELSERRFLAEMNFLEKKDAICYENEQLLYQIHFKHIVSCFIRDAAPNAKKSFSERRKNAERYLTSDLTQKMLKNYEPNSKKIKMITVVFKNKMYMFSMLLGSVSYVFQNDFKVLYRKILK